MAVVWIPSLLRNMTDGQDTVTVPGSTVGQVVDSLEQLFPGIRDRLCEGDRLRTGMAVSVDSQIARRGLQQDVGPRSEVHFIPAVSGG